MDDLIYRPQNISHMFAFLPLYMTCAYILKIAFSVGSPTDLDFNVT